MAIVKGNDLMLFKKDVTAPDSPVYKALGAATNHTLSMTREVLETSNKDTGIYGESEAGRMTWSITTENMMIEVDFDELVDLMQKGEKIVVAFAIAKNANAIGGKPEGGWVIGEGGYEGEVLITQIDANAPANDKATYTCTMTGSGPIRKRGES